MYNSACDKYLGQVTASAAQPIVSKTCMPTSINTRLALDDCTHVIAYQNKSCSLKVMTTCTIQQTIENRQEPADGKRDRSITTKRYTEIEKTGRRQRTAGRAGPSPRSDR